MPKKPQVHEPGADPKAGESDVDAAIAEGKAGRARRIAKPRAAVAPSPVKGDPERPRGMPVNMKREMTEAQAMKKLAAGELKRAVLTEAGWVVPPAKEPPEGAKRL